MRGVDVEDRLGGIQRRRLVLRPGHAPFESRADAVVYGLALDVQPDAELLVQMLHSLQQERGLEGLMQEPLVQGPITRQGAENVGQVGLEAAGRQRHMRFLNVEAFETDRLEGTAQEKDGLAQRRARLNLRLVAPEQASRGLARQGRARGQAQIGQHRVGLARIRDHLSPADGKGQSADQGRSQSVCWHRTRTLPTHTSSGCLRPPPTSFPRIR